MQKDHIEKSYASAIISLAAEQKQNILQEFLKFQELIDTNNSLKKILFFDIFTRGEKRDLLENLLLDKNFSNLFKNFLFFLVEERRLTLFSSILKEIILDADRSNGFVRGSIVGSESSMDERDLFKIEEIFKGKLKREIKLSYRQDLKISAGVKVRVEDLLLDLSLEKQLKNLKESILE